MSASTLGNADRATTTVTWTANWTRLMERSSPAPLS
jgi:hypothetical protein